MRLSLRICRLGAAAIAAIGNLAAGDAPATGGFDPLNPMIFVHGGSGSGAQFESQAMRFATNGYPQHYIRVLEYDSSQISTILPAVLAELDALIAELQAETGRPQVDLLGHSLGTFVSQQFLSTPARAANVAHYVNIDGGSAAAPPGGVPTLALWAGADPPVGSITGALNVTLDGQEHIECATSPEAFFEMYHFFRGHAPFTTRVFPQLLPKVSGQVNFFPSNQGIDGAHLDVWWVKKTTGERIGPHPWASFDIGPDGNFGPFFTLYGLNYEFSVTREGEVDVTFFYEPFIRSDNLVRLNIATGLAPFIDSGPDHSALTVVRQREFCGDLGAGSDVLEIAGTNVATPTITSCATLSAGSAAVFAFDDNVDGVTNLAAIPFPFGPLAFLTAADLVIPTAPPGVVSVRTIPRGGGDPRTVNVPNLPSSEARIVVNLHDFEP
jgi:pimeloyl-ACP methyl ester carboxylesterase